MEHTAGQPETPEEPALWERPLPWLRETEPTSGPENASAEEPASPSEDGSAPDGESTPDGTPATATASDPVPGTDETSSAPGTLFRPRTRGSDDQTPASASASSPAAEPAARGGLFRPRAARPDNPTPAPASPAAPEPATPGGLFSPRRRGRTTPPPRPHRRPPPHPNPPRPVGCSRPGRHDRPIPRPRRHRRPSPVPRKRPARRARCSARARRGRVTPADSAGRVPGTCARSGARGRSVSRSPAVPCWSSASAAPRSSRCRTTTTPVRGRRASATAPSPAHGGRLGGADRLPFGQRPADPPYEGVEGRYGQGPARRGSSSPVAAAHPDKASGTKAAHAADADAQSGAGSGSTTTKTPTSKPAAAAAAGDEIVGYGSSKCVEVSARSGVDGSPLRLWGCDGDAWQKWVFKSDGSVRSMGMCLDIADASESDGAAIQLATCNGGWAQRFKPQRLPRPGQHSDRQVRGRQGLGHRQRHPAPAVELRRDVQPEVAPGLIPAAVTSPPGGPLLRGGPRRLHEVPRAPSPRHVLGASELP